MQFLEFCSRIPASKICFILGHTLTAGMALEEKLELLELIAGIAAFESQVCDEQEVNTLQYQS